MRSPMVGFPLRVWRHVLRYNEAAGAAIPGWPGPAAYRVTSFEGSGGLRDHPPDAGRDDLGTTYFCYARESSGSGWRTRARTAVSALTWAASCSTWTAAAPRPAPTVGSAGRRSAILATRPGPS